MTKWRRSLVLMIAITVLLWTAVWVAVSVRGAPPSSLQPTYAVPPIRVLENNTGNNTGNDTCGPGSYCYTQLTQIWNALGPYYGGIGTTIAFLMDRLLLITYVMIGVVFFLPIETFLLFYYFRRQFTEVKKHKVGPEDPLSWELLYALFEMAIPEQNRAEYRERWKKLVDEAAKAKTKIDLERGFRRLRAMKDEAN